MIGFCVRACLLESTLRIDWIGLNWIGNVVLNQEATGPDFEDIDIVKHPHLNFG